MTRHPKHPSHHQGKKKTPKKKGLHKDWRMWAVVILMLIAMAAYFMTDDEALGPSGPPREEVEAVE